MKKTRVMIVEDSPVISALLEYCVSSDPRLEVCAIAGSAEDALDTFEEIAPDVIAMDIRLPGIDGLEATRRIMSKKPVPIVVVAASIESGKWNSTPMEALRAGALTVLEKPVGTTHADYAVIAERLCTQLFIMSQVKLVRRFYSRQAHDTESEIPQVSSRTAGEFEMLGIVCAGALVQLLGALGPEFPLPILLVQHMTASFVAGFASWLDTVCPFAVTLVKDGCIPARGAVYMAPAERHLRLGGGRLRLDAGDPVSFQCPSGTVLFQSMARDLGASALGVLLTGMGDDGAAGLLAIRRAHGYTIAEDESTAVVYGMPAVALHMGAVRESLPLPAIAPRVKDLVSCRNF